MERTRRQRSTGARPRWAKAPLSDHHSGSRHGRGAVPLDVGSAVTVEIADDRSVGAGDRRRDDRREASAGPGQPQRVGGRPGRVPEDVVVPVAVVVAGERGVRALDLPRHRGAEGEARRAAPQVVGGGTRGVPEDVVAPVTVVVADDRRVPAGDRRRPTGREPVWRPSPQLVRGRAGRVPEDVVVAVAVEVARERRVGALHGSGRGREGADAGRRPQGVRLGTGAVPEDVVAPVAVVVAGDRHARRHGRRRDGGEVPEPVAEEQVVRSRRPGHQHVVGRIPVELAHHRSGQLGSWCRSGEHVGRGGAHRGSGGHGGAVRPGDHTHHVEVVVEVRRVPAPHPEEGRRTLRVVGDHRTQVVDGGVGGERLPPPRATGGSLAAPQLPVALAVRGGHQRCSGDR